MTKQCEMEEYDTIKVRLKSPEFEANQTPGVKDELVESTESVEPAETVRTTQCVTKSIVYNISGNTHCVFKVTEARRIWWPALKRLRSDFRSLRPTSV
jgi:diaminopimelate epimerase